MKKIYLLKIQQKGETCYLGKIDPRELVKVAKKIPMGEVQDAQRPLNEKKVKEIASYVAEPSFDDGILPNTLTIATVDHSFTPIEEDKEKGIYYIEFPENPIEFKSYEEKILVMDGQHRLYSFLGDICLLSDEYSYEIGFCLYVNPLTDQQRKIFLICNEKQQPVSMNLLNWFKRQLNMIDEETAYLWSIVEGLEQESGSPLKGHIILGAEKKTNGVKAKQVIEALKEADIPGMKYNGEPYSVQNMLRRLIDYLSAWERVCKFKFSDKKSVAKTALSMAGLKFMLLLFRPIYEKCTASKEKFNDLFLKKTVREIITVSKIDILVEDFFRDEEFTKIHFRERGAVNSFAKECINIIKNFEDNEFDPFA